jgi:hypothetical protein
VSEGFNVFQHIEKNFTSTAFATKKFTGIFTDFAAVVDRLFIKYGAKSL